MDKVEDLLPKLDQIPAPPDAPSSEGLSELTERDTWDKGAAEHRRQEIRNLKQDIKLRKTYANRIFWFVAIYLGIVLLFVLADAMCPRFEVSDQVLMTLLTTNTATVIGMFVIVAKYLFHRQR
jgi:hypothetical protein